jgi:putative membrane-bound dehydrogenase-like protein
MIRFSALSLLVAIGFIQSALAQPKFPEIRHVDPKDYAAGQTPAEAIKHMSLPPGFKAEIVVAEPDIVQPIAMCFDERGRLWVAEGNSYPQKREGDKGPDRILIFEDTKGTGKFDKRTVFIEGLNLISGLEVGFGGVWIGAAPQLLFIPKDANDKPSEPQVLLDGWGMQDTHETLNSFIWGPDGWLYGCHGVFTYSKIGKPGTPDAERTPMNAGVWRYHPVRHEFEVFAHGTSNPWGLDYDEHGEFFITACVIPHLYHIVPGGRYQRQGGQHYNPYTYDDIKTIADHSHYAGNIRDNAHWGDHHSSVNLPVPTDTDAAGGGHAHCGLCIYQGDNFPPEYRGELIFGNIHGHRLVHDHVEPNCSSFIGEHRNDFMRSNDHWFIPIQQKLGPDGALYVSDWSDKQVCHQGSNAVEAWDRSNGRIYRISYEGVKTPRSDGILPSTPTAGSRRSLHQAPFDLNKLSHQELAKMAVEDTNEYFVRQARRVLMERCAKDMENCFKAPSDQHEKNFESLGERWEAVIEFALMAMEKPKSNVQNVRGLWLISLCGMSFDGLVDFLDGGPEDYKEDNEDWRALRKVIFRAYGDPHPYGTLDPKAKDTLHFRADTYRLVKSAQKDPSCLVRREIASLLQRIPMAAPKDRTDIALALLAHAEDAEDPTIPLLIWYGIEPVVGADAEAGMKLAAASKMDKVTGFIYRRMSTDDAGRNALLTHSAEITDAAQREKMLAMIVDSAGNTGRHEMPKDWSTVSAKLRAGASARMLSLIDEVSALFGEEASIQKFRDDLAQNRKPQHALGVLLQIHDVATAKILQQIILSEKPAGPIREKAIQALVSLADSENAAVLVKAYPRLSSDEKTFAISTLTSTRDGASALLQAIGSKQIESQMLTPFLVRQLQAFNDPELNTLINKATGTVNKSKADLPEQKAKWRATLTAEKLKAADPNKGYDLFKGTCATCHKLLGEGANVGPDLTGSNRANLDYLLDNVLDPSAVIGKGYELNIFTMKDARVLSGIMKEETSTGYKLSMPGGVEFVLGKVEVSKRDILKVSMMPEGQFDALGPENVANLVAYLQKDVGARRSDAAQGKAASENRAPSVEGALEGEALKVTKITGGQTKIQNMGGFKNSRWSGGSQLWWTSGKVGDSLALSLPVSEKGRYSLKAVLTKAKDYGIVEISLDGKVLSDGKIDFYNPEVVTSGELDWGLHDLEAGEHSLEVRIIGANPNAASAYLFGLDYLKLEKK